MSKIRAIEGCPYGATTDNSTRCICGRRYGHNVWEFEMNEPKPGSSEGLAQALAKIKTSAPGVPTLLPSDPKERKLIPVGTGVLDYFSAALIEVAKVSHFGNEQHNPGEALHWSRGKSTDQADTIIRHWLERGGIDTDGMRHSAKLAWRALALLQEEMEAAGAPISRGSK